MTVHLSNRNADMRLMLALQKSIGLKAMGCRFHRGLVGGISVTLSEEVLGIWCFEDSQYNFSTYVGGGVAASASSADQAIERTISIASSRFSVDP